VKEILDYKLKKEEAAFWWLGQAGYIIRTAELTIAIDPYLSDSAAEHTPELTRLYPPPMDPTELDVNIYIVTHDHLDHLDPVTIRAYRNKGNTLFIAPRQAAKKLVSLGVPEQQTVVLHAGESRRCHSVEITGVFALATSGDVIDTTGYFIKFDNGRSVYHTSDTEYHPLVVAAATKTPDVMFVPINGKWGNPNAEDAALFAKALMPRFVLPNHYDLMALNAENPEVFRWFCNHHKIGDKFILPRRMEPFVWSN
jgi:L-ascorbate 6-phosphate lactonase